MINTGHAPHISDGKDNKWRFELKYRIDCMQYQKLRMAIMPHMRKDAFTRRGPRGRYLVRSLYYDTYDYKTLDQKMSGDSERVKFRLRTYSEFPGDRAVIRAEIKARRSGVTEKNVEIVSVEDYLYFMRHRHWPRSGRPVLDEFERRLHLDALGPKVLIEYLREGYEDRRKQGIRVTFDHRVRSVQADNLFPERKIFFRSHNPLGIVFEVKCHHQRTDWLRRLVREHGLKPVANSKFTQAIEIARHDLYRSDGVVVIR